MTQYERWEQPINPVETLWTQGDQDGTYWIELNISGSAGAQAAAWLHWTDPSTIVRSLGVQTEYMGPQPGGRQQTVTGPITVKAGTPVIITAACLCGTYNLAIVRTP